MTGKTKRELRKKINDSRIKSNALRVLAFNNKFDKGQEIREDQQKEWDKLQFFKNLQNAIR